MIHNCRNNNKINDSAKYERKIADRIFVECLDIKLLLHEYSRKNIFINLKTWVASSSTKHPANMI